MRLLGPELSGSGLSFVRARIVHGGGPDGDSYAYVAHVVVPTDDDVTPMRTWLRRNGWVPSKVRPAAAAELEEWEEISE